MGETSLTVGQTVVLRAFKDFGAMDDTALAVYVHHVAAHSMSSSGIRSRRAELARKGLLQVVGTKELKSGRRAAIHDLTGYGYVVARLLEAEAAEAVV